MNEMQFKPGDLVKHRYSLCRGIVRSIDLVGCIEIHWFARGPVENVQAKNVIPTSKVLELLSRGPNND